MYKLTLSPHNTLIVSSLSFPRHRNIQHLHWLVEHCTLLSRIGKTPPQIEHALLYERMVALPVRHHGSAPRLALAPPSSSLLPLVFILMVEEWPSPSCCSAMLGRLLLGVEYTLLNGNSSCSPLMAWPNPPSCPAEFEDSSLDKARLAL